MEVRCFAVSLEKKHVKDAVEAVGKLSKEISLFIREHYAFFQSFLLGSLFERILQSDNQTIEISPFFN